MTELGLNVTLWNVEWAKPSSTRGTMVHSLLDEGTPGVICVTEGFAEIFPSRGHAISSDSDYGYGTVDGRRKVMLWSASAWTEVDPVGHPKLPPGRFITGVTETPLGSLRFVAVCIPWHDAHVRTGTRDRMPWEDHANFIDGLAAYLHSLIRDLPVVLLGDFNQRLPRSRQPQDVHDRLMSALQPHLRVVTGGVFAEVNAQSIDHLAVSEELEATSVSAFSNIAPGGTKLSDHFGLRLTLQREVTI